MLAGHDILCFAPGPWDDIWRNRHQIMTRLARTNRILYVEPWEQLRPLLRRLRNGEVRLNELMAPSLRQMRSNLWVYHPPQWAPRAERFPIKGVTWAIYGGLLKRTLRQLNFRDPILWLFLPDMEIFVGQFGEKLLVYHIVDEYSGYSGVSGTWRPVMQCMEEHLARRADVVFVTSPTLLERKRGLNDRTFLIPNAVDYTSFAGATGDDRPLPADVANLPRPLAGYVGAINEKVDLSLLAHIARSLPTWSLALVGPLVVGDLESRKAAQELRGMPNVFFLGKRKVADVPLYIAACDVCLLPYRVNEWTQNIDSLKLYEYLACGKPVVCTALPTAQRFPSAVRIANSEEEFLSQMTEAVEEDNLSLQAERQAVAAQNTWEHRVAQISTIIETCLKERQLSHVEARSAQKESA
jgi:glycosyltransferase involved in cell wall biosynthesis